MKMRLIAVGKIDAEWLREGIAWFEQRVSKYGTFSTTELHHPKKGNLSPDDIRKLETEAIIWSLTGREHLILLDSLGKQLSSEGFARLIEKHRLHATKELTFVIGGAFGFTEGLQSRAADIISFSKLTFPHQLFRLIFLEQLYRAFTILKGEKYHHA